MFVWQQLCNFIKLRKKHTNTLKPTSWLLSSWLGILIIIEKLYWSIICIDIIYSWLLSYLDFSNRFWSLWISGQVIIFCRFHTNDEMTARRIQEYLMNFVLHSSWYFYLCKIVTRTNRHDKSVYTKNSSYLLFTCLPII